MAKIKNLQPWVEYFQMLRKYEENGYLDVKASEMEAYITQPALLTLSGEGEISSGDEQLAIQRMVRETPKILRRLRTYSAWKSQKGDDALSLPFALHVVKPDVPHDLICTLTISRKRVWWKLWMKTDVCDLIEY